MPASTLSRLVIVAGLAIAFLALPLLPHSATAALKDQERWDGKYSLDAYLFGKAPVTFLKENVGLLPKGKALDIAMGEGRNGVFLATQGFDVLGVDISKVGLAKAHQLAKEHNVSIETRVVDLETVQLEKNKYDVILMMYYMQRNLFPQIKQALKPGGMVMVETYNLDYLKYQNFRREWALEQNELLDVFKDFKIIRYQAYDDGKVAFSSIIAQKPLP